MVYIKYLYGEKFAAENFEADSEREPTEEEGSLFSEFFSLNDEIMPDRPLLYHYRSGEVLEKIFLGDEVIFRISRSDFFDDRTEGKIILDYYHKAIVELYDDHEISAHQFDILSRVEIPNIDLFIYGDQQEGHLAKSLKYDVYILCFSTEKGDPFMFENYAKGGKGRFCLELFGFEVDGHHTGKLETQTRSELVKVLYGDDAVRIIKKKVLSVLKTFHSPDSINAVMENYLHELQYAVKGKEYAAENEIRLMVGVPHNTAINNSRYERDVQERFIWLHLSNTVIAGISFDPTNNPDDTEKVRQLLINRGYIFDF